MNKQVFFDPQRKRWKRLIFDIVALVGVVVGVLFTIGLMRMTPLPELLLATPKPNYIPIPLQLDPTPVGQKPQRQRTARPTRNAVRDHPEFRAKACARRTTSKMNQPATHR